MRLNNIVNIKLKNLITKSNIFLTGFISIRDRQEKINRDELRLKINDNYYKIKFPFKRINNIRGIAILSNFYIVKITCYKLHIFCSSPNWCTNK